MRYLVLLRGINVGGHNKVPMADLRAYASDLGLRDVATCINSGNLIVESEAAAEDVTRSVTGGFAERFGFPVRAVTLAAGPLVSELEGLPDWWRADYARKYAMFYMAGIDLALVRERVGTYGLLEHENIHVGGLALYWGVRDRADINRSALKRYLMGERFYSDLTLRNSNTCERLASLLRA
ncbi:MAG: DUF1697 domain-containing protein [Olsenella sp.]|nr:DUF1697 domain-containing protein [Olsenella sp.]